MTQKEKRILVKEVVLALIRLLIKKKIITKKQLDKELK